MSDEAAKLTPAERKHAFGILDAFLTDNFQLPTHGTNVQIPAAAAVILIGRFLRQMDQPWYPIETYPDGVRALFWMDGGERGNGGMESGMAFRDDDGVIRVGWTHGGPNAGSEYFFFEQPSMWMPEPAGPRMMEYLAAGRTEAAQERHAVVSKIACMVAKYGEQVDGAPRHDDDGVPSETFTHREWRAILAAIKTTITETESGEGESVRIISPEKIGDINYTHWTKSPVTPGEHVAIYIPQSLFDTWEGYCSCGKWKAVAFLNPYTCDDALAALRVAHEVHVGAAPMDASAEWKALLDSRDKFLVDNGLWDRFVAQLPTTPASGGAIGSNSNA